MPENSNIYSLNTFYNKHNWDITKFRLGARGFIMFTMWLYMSGKLPGLPGSIISCTSWGEFAPIRLYICPYIYCVHTRSYSLALNDILRILQYLFLDNYIRSYDAFYHFTTGSIFPGFLFGMCIFDDFKRSSELSMPCKVIMLLVNMIYTFIYLSHCDITNTCSLLVLKHHLSFLYQNYTSDSST